MNFIIGFIGFVVLYLVFEWEVRRIIKDSGIEERIADLEYRIEELEKETEGDEYLAELDAEEELKKLEK